MLTDKKNGTNRNCLVLVVGPHSALESSSTVGTSELDDSNLLVGGVDRHLAESVAMSSSSCTGQTGRAVVSGRREG